MKVLYISNYKDGTGWGNAATDYILAMDSVGIDVVCRSISFNGEKGEVHPRILELERKSSRHSNVCIQHLLPHMLDYNGRFEKNIALYESETSNFKSSRWTEYINTMDEAWVVNKQMSEASLSSGVESPIRIIPHTFDTSKYDKEYKPLDIPYMDIENKFVFYFIGEAIRRKNIFALIKAFHLEFDVDEPVDLIIKASKGGMSDDDCGKYIKELCDTAKENLKLYPSNDLYKSEFITTGFLDNEKMMRFHKTMDCFVMPSYGEAWCIPALESMALGVPVIHTQGTGMDDFCSGWPVQSRSTRCYLANDSLDNVYTSLTSWQEIDIEALASTMRIAYETYKNDKQEWNKMKEMAKQKAQNYSIQKIGQKMKELLDG